MEMLNSKHSERNMESTIILIHLPLRRKLLPMSPFTILKFTNGSVILVTIGRLENTIKLVSMELDTVTRFLDYLKLPPIPLIKKLFNKLLMDYSNKTSSLILPQSFHALMMLLLIKSLSSVVKYSRKLLKEALLTSFN
jgi:hypothetical protein